MTGPGIGITDTRPFFEMNECPACADFLLIHCSVFAQGFTVAGVFKSNQRYLLSISKLVLGEGIANDDLQNGLGTMRTDLMLHERFG